MATKTGGTSHASRPPTPLYDDSTFPNDTQGEEVPVPTEEELLEFRRQTAEWLKIDDTIKKLQIAIRERKTHHRALTTKIQSFMIRFGYDNLNTKQGVIKSNVRDVKVPIKMATLREEIEKLGSQMVNAAELLKKLFESERQTVLKQSLSRRVPKVSMALDI